jgi:hypothetical protein
MGDAEGSKCGVGVAEGVGSASAGTVRDSATPQVRLKYLLMDFIV